MRKQVTYIDCPKEWESKNDWDSHRGALWWAINKIPHDSFFEYGVGDGSTPLLKEWYTGVNLLGKEYYSIETNHDWVQRYITNDYEPGLRENTFVCKNHCICHFRDYSTVALPNSLVFVDSAPGEGRKDIIINNGNAQAVIVHDSEKSSSYVYDLEKTLSKFKYRVDYEPIGKPHTSIVSNVININEYL